MTLATSSQIDTPDLLWPYSFCQMDWEVTPPAVQDYIRDLQKRVKQLQGQVETLQGRLDQTPQTSSKRRRQIRPSKSLSANRASPVANEELERDTVERGRPC
jgi:hypothetical protein